MLTIRLYPMGRKHKRQYRVVLANKKYAVSKQYIENLGFYDPISKEIRLTADRVKYWLGQNVEVSDRVLTLLKKEGISK
jgi:small subunit ribosomal protein S16